MTTITYRNHAITPEGNQWIARKDGKVVCTDRTSEGCCDQLDVILGKSEEDKAWERLDRISKWRAF